MHLERLTLILEIVAQKGEATVADICKHSDLPKPSAYRLVQDLVGVGLLEPTAKGRFSIGSRLKRLSQADQTDVTMVELIGPMLKRAAVDHGATFFLSRLRGRGVEIIHAEIPDTGVSYLHPGLGRRPLHACSCSKAVIAFNPEIEVLQELEGRLKAYTEFTLTSVKDLEEELNVIRERGFAECVEELERGMCSVAAPITTSGIGATLSIGATGSTRVFTPTFRSKIGEECILLATRTAEKLGWADPGTDKQMLFS